MNNIATYLDKLQRLTYSNLEILKAINDSFFTKNNHITIKVGNTNYNMPSFLSLENKINSLLENLYNLVNSPKTGEAYFNMNGNSRAIEVRGYMHTPNSITVNPVDKFETYKNNIFKDFLTPVPFINISLKDIPDDITSVNIKKIIPIQKDLINIFKTKLDSNTSVNFKWSDLYKILSQFQKDKDYIEYDTVNKLPIRKNIGTGVYVIEKIIKDYVDLVHDNLDNYIELKFRSDLKDPYMKDLSYRLFDETIYKPLIIGDELVTYDDSAKMEIIDLNQSTNTITVKVSNGEYLNLSLDATSTENINDLCKLKFYSPIDFEKDKYIKIPLEEDQYIFTAVAPLNDRMNIQSPWGTGLILNTYDLKYSENPDVKFNKYYDENVKNIGDILFEITSSMTNTVTSLNPDEYETITKIKPIIDVNNINVIQINKHLNNSQTVKNIRNLYSQKNIYKDQLEECQAEINKTNLDLSKISFDDVAGIRTSLIEHLRLYNKKKNELITSITKITNEISLSANQSEIPIENAKYRIRGFFNYKEFADQLGRVAIDHIKGISVQYRYKNINLPQGDAYTFNDEFLFSDWNVMRGFVNPKISKYEETIKFENKEDNSLSNEPSFNQIDIPISQGETVDVKLKVIYDYGYPFVETTSDWSEIVNISFPTEFLKDVQILDIISENNNDIETNRFKDIISEQGIPEHIGDKVMDLDLIYFHRPENISSGFYTSERRVIPLKDKLLEFSNKIASLLDEVSDSSSDSIKIKATIGNILDSEILPHQMNNIGVESYNTFANQDMSKLNNDGVYIYDASTGIVQTTLNIVISNVTQHTVKLFSMFPGSRDVLIGNLKSSKYDQNDFFDNSTKTVDKGIWVSYNDNNTGKKEYKLQSANQFINFRINDPYDGHIYYKNEANPGDPELPSDKNSYIQQFHNRGLGMIMYPNINEKFALCLNNDIVKTYLQIAPDESMIIPIIIKYKLKDSGLELDSISKTMSFDLRTSLYNDPINYTFTVTAKTNNTTQDKLIVTNKKFVTDVNYKSIVP